MSTYQPGIPTGTVNLDVDYQNIQNNFQQLDTTFGVDHVTYSNQTAQNGYHTSIHFNPVSTTATNPPDNQPPVIPAAVAGYGQLFSAEINDGVNSDTALYFLTGGNRLQQLTRNFVPQTTDNGYTFLPGGLILQWGLINTNFSGSGIGTVTFNVGNISFPTACRNVSTTMRGTSGTANLVEVSSVSNLNFTWKFTGGTGATSYTGFYWIAIGL